MPLNRVCQEINHALTKYNMQHLHVSVIDVLPSNNLIQLKPSSKFHTYISGLPKDRITSNGSFFRFVEDADRLSDILTNGKIRLYNLNSQEDNDFAEYTEMYNRLGHSQSTGIDEARRDTYILCLAKEMHNERMWKDYTNNKGVCYRVRVERKQSPPLTWSFKDIYYDSGYDLDFYKEARYRVSRFTNFTLVPQISGLTHFYKRAKYRWENESRISIKDLPNGAMTPPLVFTNNVNSHFSIVTSPEDHNYIVADLDNVLFKLTIEEVFCEKQIDSSKFTRLQTLCASKNIPIHYKE